MDSLDFVKKIAYEMSRIGGTLYLVGGCIRDGLMGRTPKDFDCEVFGVSPIQLQELLSSNGTVDLIGKSFGTFKVHEYPDVDFSLPRKDSKRGIGHKDFEVVVDPGMTIKEAARRRDFTINSMSVNPLTGEFLDPYYGKEDIKNRILRAVDKDTFIEDDLRALRGIQFAARFLLNIETDTKVLMSNMDLSTLPGERIQEEFNKLFRSHTPSFGLGYLEHLGLIRYFPEIRSLIGCEQEPEWHPEGTVFQHTLLVVDEAAVHKDLVISYAALCHDFGKPSTTEVKDGRIRSNGHDVAGVDPTESFLSRLKFGNGFKEQVKVLVETHLAPSQFVKQGAGASSYRRLGRKLFNAGVDFQTLYKVGMSDHFGRTTLDAINRDYSDGAKFLEKADSAGVIKEEGNKDIVMGRHLIARGYKPGVQFKEILTKCRELQIETGSCDPDYLLNTILSLS